jgi:hypothetical protein
MFRTTGYSFWRRPLGLACSSRRLTRGDEGGFMHRLIVGRMCASEYTCMLWCEHPWWPQDANLITRNSLNTQYQPPAMQITPVESLCVKFHAGSAAGSILAPEAGSEVRTCVCLKMLDFRLASEERARLNSSKVTARQQVIDLTLCGATLVHAKLTYYDRRCYDPCEQKGLPAVSPDLRRHARAYCCSL